MLFLLCFVMSVLVTKQVVSDKNSLSLEHSRDPHFQLSGIEPEDS